jgi:mevalonate kinase
MATIEQQIQNNFSLDDIYKAFSKKKKHYATRLKHAFLENNVESLDDLMKLSINDLSNMDGIGSETLRLLIKNLNSMGIDYYPVKNDDRAAD